MCAETKGREDGDDGHHHRHQKDKRKKSLAVPDKKEEEDRMDTSSEDKVVKKSRSTDTGAKKTVSKKTRHGDKHKGEKKSETKKTKARKKKDDKQHSSRKRQRSTSQSSSESSDSDSDRDKPKTKKPKHKRQRVDETKSQDQHAEPKNDSNVEKSVYIECIPDDTTAEAAEICVGLPVPKDELSRTPIENACEMLKKRGYAYFILGYEAKVIMQRQVTAAAAAAAEHAEEEEDDDGEDLDESSGDEDSGTRKKKKAKKKAKPKKVRAPKEKPPVVYHVVAWRDMPDTEDSTPDSDGSEPLQPRPDIGILNIDQVPLLAKTKEETRPKTLIVLRDKNLPTKIRNKIDAEIRALGVVRIEHFDIMEFAVDVTENAYVPDHVLLSPEKALRIKKTLGDGMLLMPETDPQAKYYGAVPGDVFEIRRFENDIAYRLVTASTAMT